jgi:hypothetical protein
VNKAIRLMMPLVDVECQDAPVGARFLEFDADEPVQPIKRILLEFHLTHLHCAAAMHPIAPVGVLSRMG